MLRYSFDLDKEADAVETAVKEALKEGYRTADIISLSGKAEPSLPSRQDRILPLGPGSDCPADSRTRKAPAVKEALKEGYRTADIMSEGRITSNCAGSLTSCIAQLSTSICSNVTSG